MLTRDEIFAAVKKIDRRAVRLPEGIEAIANHFFAAGMEEAAKAACHNEVLLAERDHALTRLDIAVKQLVGIHALLYPAPVAMPDGRTMEFRPKSTDPHEVLQALSDRIRAIPDELEAIRAKAKEL